LEEDEIRSRGRRGNQRSNSRRWQKQGRRKTRRKNRHKGRRTLSSDRKRTKTRNTKH
jgi:hypothetical protein